MIVYSKQYLEISPQLTNELIYFYFQEFRFVIQSDQGDRKPGMFNQSHKALPCSKQGLQN